MKWVNDDYSHNLRIYEKRDARKAIIVYCLILGSAFFQGWLYTTNLNVYVLNLSQIGIPFPMNLNFPHKEWLWLLPIVMEYPEYSTGFLSAPSLLLTRLPNHVW